MEEEEEKNENNEVERGVEVEKEGTL